MEPHLPSPHFSRPHLPFSPYSRPHLPFPHFSRTHFPSPHSSRPPLPSHSLPNFSRPHLLYLKYSRSHLLSPTFLGLTSYIPNILGLISYLPTCLGLASHLPTLLGLISHPPNVFDLIFHLLVCHPWLYFWGKNSLRSSNTSVFLMVYSCCRPSSTIFKTQDQIYCSHDIISYSDWLISKECDLEGHTKWTIKGVWEFLPPV